MKLLCGVAVNEAGEVRPVYLHPDMSLAAWRYYLDNGKISNNTVRRQKRADIKIYKLHTTPVEGEKVYIFSVDSIRLKTWLEAQPAPAV